MNVYPIASIVGLLIALGVTTLFAFIKQGDKGGPINQLRRLATMWGTCLALLALVLLWEQRSLSSIGIVWGNYGAWAIGIVVGGAIHVPRLPDRAPARHDRQVVDRRCHPAGRVRVRASGDLVACMIAHALIDSLIIFLPAMLRKLAPSPA